MRQRSKKESGSGHSQGKSGRVGVEFWSTRDCSSTSANDSIVNRYPILGRRKLNYQEGCG